MSVWFCIPSARPPEQVEPVLAKWKAQGYKIALWLDKPSPPLAMNGAMDFSMSGEYPGYSKAVNNLALEVLKRDPACDWVVAGGDDTLPDPNHTAEEIAEQCSHYFFDKAFHNKFPEYKKLAESGACIVAEDSSDCTALQTFGVMQPTGDRFAGGSIDRIAGSPWMGREWCLRANQGKGPLWPEFTHMFGDECLKRTAEKLGVYWMRPDLTQLHLHFQRESMALDSRAVKKEIPPHLVHWNTQEHWDEMKAIFKRLEAEDFKSCMPN